MNQFITRTLGLAALSLSLSLSAMAHAAPPGDPATAGYAALDRYVAPAPTTAAAKRFSAPSGASFHETVDRWAAQAGWKPVVWQLPAETDFTLGKPSQFEGDLFEAIGQLAITLGSEATLLVSMSASHKIITITEAQMK